MMLGMLGCGECSQALSAVGVIPGRLAMTSKGGAWGFGELVCPASTAWHAAHTLCAYASPRAGEALADTSGGDGAGGAWASVPTQALARRANPTSVRLRIDLDIGASKMLRNFHFERTPRNTHIVADGCAAQVLAFLPFRPIRPDFVDKAAGARREPQPLRFSCLTGL